MSDPKDKPQQTALAAGMAALQAEGVPPAPDQTAQLQRTVAEMQAKMEQMAAQIEAKSKNDFKPEVRDDAALFRIPFDRVKKWAASPSSAGRYYVFVKHDPGIDYRFARNIGLIADEPIEGDKSGRRTPGYNVEFKTPNHMIGADLPGYAVLMADIFDHDECRRTPDEAKQLADMGLPEYKEQRGFYSMQEVMDGFLSVDPRYRREFITEAQIKPILLGLYEKREAEERANAAAAKAVAVATNSVDLYGGNVFETLKNEAGALALAGA